MAGSNAGFDPAGFRTAIRSAMTMGLPSSVSERATFRWPTDRTYQIADPAQNPYDWTEATTTETHHADVQIPVAIEFTSRTSQAGSNDLATSFDTSRAVLTVLDEDYALVAGATEVLLGENTYLIQFVAPPMGLFEVTIYQVYLQARDES